MILVCKGTCGPVAPPSEGQGGQCPRNAPRSVVPGINQFAKAENDDIDALKYG